LLRFLSPCDQQGEVMTHYLNRLLPSIQSFDETLTRLGEIREGLVAELASNTTHNMTGQGIIADLMKIDALMAVLGDLLSMMARIKEMGSDAPEFEDAIERTLTRVGYPSDPMSRSTSVLSNLADDVTEWAKREVRYRLVSGF